MHLLPWEHLLKLDRSQGDFGLEGKFSIMRSNKEAAQKNPDTYKLEYICMILIL